MEIRKDILERIIKYTQCAWTRGYISSILDHQTPTQEEILRDMIESCGKNKIAAIKKLRDHLGIGLMEAKQLIEHYWTTGEINLDDDNPTSMVST